MNILIVEDDSSCRDIIRHHLLKFKESFFSLEIYEADTVKNALEIFDNREPDMVILDGTLPDSPFEETLKLIPKFSANAAVIILTNQEKMEGAVQAIKLGAVDYLTKHVLTSGKEFVATLQSAWSNFEREKMKQTGAFPTVRAKQVTEELAIMAEKTMTPAEIRGLIEFSQFARANIEEIQKRLNKVYITIFEGNGAPSIKQDLFELRELVDAMKKKNEDAEKEKKEGSKEKWGFYGIIATGVLGLLGGLFTFLYKWADFFFKIH